MKLSPDARRYRIFQILSNRDEDDALTVAEVYNTLVDEGYEVGKKTIQRDLTKDMEKFRLLETESYPVRYYADKESYNPNIELALTKDNLFTIVVALDALRSTSPNHIQKLCSDTLLTIGEKIPNELKESFDYFQLVSKTQESITGRSVAKDDKSFEKLFHLVIEGAAFECKIKSPNKDIVAQNVIRKFYPIFFVFSNNIPYLYAQDLETNKIKQLRMTRLVDVKGINDTLNREKLLKSASMELKKSFSGYSGGSSDLINYEIICDKQMATYFEEKELCSNQKVEELYPNKYKITFSLNDNRQIARLIAGFGGHIESIKPNSFSSDVLSIWNQDLKKAA